MNLDSPGSRVVVDLSKLAAQRSFCGGNEGGMKDVRHCLQFTKSNYVKRVIERRIKTELVDCNGL